MRRTLILALALATSGCVHARDFRAPHERITRRTAYVLDEWQGEAGLDLVGLGLTDFGVNAGVHGTVGKRVQLGANLAHGAFGILNADGKVNIVDHPVAGVGIESGIFYANPRAIYVLPSGIRDDLGDIHLVVVPTTLRTSFPLTEFMSLHLGTGYKHASIVGKFSNDSDLADGGLGSRDFYFEPQSDFYLGRRVALRFGAHLSAYATARTNTAVESELEPGVRVGVVSAEWRRLSFSATSSYYGAIQTRFGYNTYVQLSVTVGRFKPLPLPNVLPALSFAWRFGGKGHEQRREQYKRDKAARKAARKENRSK